MTWMQGEKCPKKQITCQFAKLLVFVRPFALFYDNQILHLVVGGLLGIFLVLSCRMIG